MPVASRAHKQQLRGDSGLPDYLLEDLDFEERDTFKAKAVEAIEDVSGIQDAAVFGEVPEELYNEQELIEYIREELNFAESERWGFLDDLARWKEAYRAPDQGAKNFPFIGASNIMVPLIKEHSDTIVAALSQTILVPGPVWIFKHYADEWRNFKNITEQFLDLAARRELKYEDRMEDFIREGVKLGTSILESGYEVKERKFYLYNRDGTKAGEKLKVVKSGPTLWNVPLEDFWIRFTEMDIQDAPWVAKEYVLNRQQVKQKVFDRCFRADAAKLVLLPYTTTGDGAQTNIVREKSEILENTVPILRNNFTFHEVWLSWNLDDGDDFESELVVDFHRETNSIMSVRFHPFRHGMRPFEVWRYIRHEHRFYGEGLCERLEQVQNEITVMHNQRRDNATVANLPMISAKRGTTSIRPDDPLYVTKIIYRDDKDDLTPFRLGEIYPSTVQEEQIARQMAQSLSGISDANIKGGFPVTRTTFGAQAMLLQEQAKRLDNAIRNLRKASGNVGNMVFSYYMQFGAEGKPEAWLGRRGAILNGVFALPDAAVDLGLGIEANAPTSQLNRETQRQNSLALFNLMVQLHEKLLLLFQGLQPPPEVLAAVIGGLVHSARQFMLDVLEQFEVSNPEEQLAVLEFIEQIVPSPTNLGGEGQFQEERRVALLLDELDRLRGTLESAAALRPQPNGKQFEPVPTSAQELPVDVRATLRG